MLPNSTSKLEAAPASPFVRGFFLPRKTPPARVCATGPFGGRLQQELTGIGAEHRGALCHAGTQPRVCSATGASRIINFTEVLPFHHISELRRGGSQKEMGGLPSPNWRLWG